MAGTFYTPPAQPQTLSSYTIQHPQTYYVLWTGDDRAEYVAAWDTIRSDNPGMTPLYMPGWADPESVRQALAQEAAAAAAAAEAARIAEEERTVDITARHDAFVAEGVPSDAALLLARLEFAARQSAWRVDD